MHIPDGFLSGPVAVAAGAIALGGVSMALYEARRQMPAKRVPLMGLAAAFVFAAQMLNFPVAGGTSGHMVGGVLCSVLLGPSAAIVVISCVLVVQCFVFADGGVLALGANIFNMAMVCSVGGYAIYRAMWKLMPNERGRLAAVAFASWASTVVAAIVCAGELAASNTVSWSVAFPAMAGVHMLIGVGEAIITTLVVFSIARARPDLMERREGMGAEPRGYGEVMVFGMLIALGLALFVSPFACSWPDGLDHVAEGLGFKSREVSHSIVTTVMPNYLFPGIKSAAVATSIAGMVGTIMAFVMAFVFARILTPATEAQTQAKPDTGRGDA